METGQRTDEDRTHEGGNNETCKTFASATRPEPASNDEIYTVGSL